MKQTELEHFESYELYVSSALELYKKVKPFPLSNLMSISEFMDFTSEIENNPDFQTIYDGVVKRSYEELDLDYDETTQTVRDIVRQAFEKKQQY